MFIAEGSTHINNQLLFALIINTDSVLEDEVSHEGLLYLWIGSILKDHPGIGDSEYFDILVQI